MAGNEIKDMTKGSPFTLILGFALPMLIGLLFQQFYSMVDTIIVGKYLGVKALAAVGSTGSLNFMIIGFCIGVCSGFAIPVAQRFGAGDYRGLRKYTANAAWLSLVFSIVMAVIVCVLCRPILEWMKTPEDIIDQAFGYIFVIFAGIPATYLYNMTAGIIRSLGDSKTPVYFLLLSSVLNIALDLFTIVVLKMGVAGAAYATVISQAVSGLLCLLYMKKHFEILKMEKDEKKIDRHLIGRLCGMGIPMGLQFSITAIGTIIVQGAVNIYGAVYMAGFSAAGKLQNIIVTVFTAFGATVATYVGQNRGAGKMDRVHKGVRYTQIMVFVWSAVTMVLVYFFGEEMTLLFVSKTETEVLHAAEVYFRTVFWAYPFLGSIFIYRNALQGMGYGLVPMLGGVFELAARALIVLLVAGKTSFFGVCLADPAAWISALIPLIPYYIYVMKKYEKQKQLEG